MTTIKKDQNDKKENNQKKVKWCQDCDRQTLNTKCPLCGKEPLTYFRNPD